jgi:transcriptional regulator with XRE-family HTH domain
MPLSDGMSKRTSVDVDALRQALEEATLPGKKWSRRALSLAAGMGPDGVRDILSGRSKNPSFRTVLALSDAMGMPASRFLDLPDEQVASAVRVPIVGAVEPGVWREDPFDPEDLAETVPAVVHTTLPVKRFALLMRGLSMDELFSPDDILYCEYAEENEIPLSVGHLAVVLRERSGLYEVTAREIWEKESDHVVLRSRTTVPSLRFEKKVEFVEPYLAVDENGERFDVVGVIRGVYRPIRGLDRMRDVSRKSS